MSVKMISLVKCSLAIAIMLIFTSLVYATPVESEKLLAEGVDAYNSGNKEAALHLFEMLISKDPSWPYGWLWKGTVLSDMGHQVKAESAFKKGRCLLYPETCEVSPGDDVPEVKDWPWKNSRPDHASRPATLQEASDLTEHSIYDDRSVHQYGRTFNDNSGQGLFRGLESYPKSHEHEGDELMKAGMYDEALHSFLLAEEMDPENPELSRKVGDMFRELGDLGSALDAWNRSVQNETDQKLTDDLRKKRADAYSAMDMPEQGIRELMKIEYPGIDPAVELQKGELYSRLQDYSRAEEFFQNSLLSDPGNADASLGLANARICQGKIAGAEEVLDSLSSSSLDPDQAVLFEKLKKEVKNYPPARTDDISFLFSSPELLIMTVIGAIGIFYFRDKIFR